MSILKSNNVKVVSKGSSKALLYIHGFGCDQNMWRFITPAFADTHCQVVYDLTGSGASDLSKYDRAKYASLNGHAADVLEICKALELTKVTLVGHSVSSMIAALAANQNPDLVESIVMVGPSPCYINDGDYIGGFTQADIDGLLQMLDANYLGWSSQMAPAIMGITNGPELSEELTASFCRTDPDIAGHFAGVTFLSDHREDAKAVKHPCLLLQCSDDVIAPTTVGEWLASNIENSELVLMNATGHCPHLSAPEETIASMRKFFDRSR